MTEVSSPAGMAGGPGAGGHDPYRRWRLGLIVFGAIELLLALLVAVSTIVLSVLVLGGSSALPLGGASADLRALGPSLLLYAAAAAVLACTGIGSILKRRWVRPIALLVGWPWLLAGCLVVGLVIASIASSGSAGLLAPSWGMNSGGGVEVVILAALLGLILVLYVLLPGLLVWFYQHRRLREALEHLDPVTRWTDRCPAPVLGLSLGLGFGALGCLAALFQPSLGLLEFGLTGGTARAVLVASALVMAAIAVAVYRRSPAAWWATLVLTLLLTGVSIEMARRFDVGDFWRSLGIAEETMPAQSSTQGGSPVLMAATILFGLACLGYLLYVRRLFVRDKK